MDREDDIGELPVLKRQSNGYNCGSTALHAVMAMLGLNPELTPADVEEIVGTNPVIGTTGSLLGASAKKLRLNMRPILTTSVAESLRDRRKFDSFDAAEYLFERLRQDLLLLRTVVGGSRHWIVAYDTRDPNDGARKTIEVFDPAYGYVTMPIADVVKIWRARDYDGFRLPLWRGGHLASTFPVERADVPGLKPYRKPIHEMSFEEFACLGDANAYPRVVAESSYGELESRAIDEARKFLRAADKNRNFRPMSFDHPELSFFAECGSDRMNAMKIVDRKTGETVGIVTNGIPFVPEAHRGRGIGTAIVLAAYSDPRLNFLHPTHYSVSGYKARLSAYRKACAQAGVEPRIAEKSAHILRDENFSSPPTAKDFAGVGEDALPTYKIS